MESKQHRLVVLGAGESGAGAAYLAQQQGYEVFVSDFGSIADQYKKQLQDWKKEHPGSPKKAAQHLHKPGTTPKTAAKPKPKQQSDSRTKTRTAK